MKKVGTILAKDQSKKFLPSKINNYFVGSSNKARNYQQFANKHRW